MDKKVNFSLEQNGEKKKANKSNIKIELNRPEWKNKEGKHDFSAVNAAIRAMGIEI